MKKWMSCVSLLLVSLFVGAQDFGLWEQKHAKDPITAVYRNIVRARAANQKLPWVKAVQDQLFAAEPHGYFGSNNWKHVAALPNEQVPPATQQKVAARTQPWQNALAANAALKRFRVSVPHAQTIVNLPDEHARYITGFLQAPITVSKQDKRFAPVSVEVYKQFLVRVTLKPNPDAWPVHLIFNCYSKQMYVSYPWLEVPDVTFEKLK